MTDMNSIRQTIQSYFETLFMESNSAANYSEVPRGLFPRLNTEQTQELSKSFIAGDVVKALKTMGPLKAPGPNGYHAYFFKKYWDLVGDPICETVVGILRGHEIPEGLNETFISLIPKVSNRQIVSQLGQLDYATWFTS